MAEPPDCGLGRDGTPSCVTERGTRDGDHARRRRGGAIIEAVRGLTIAVFLAGCGAEHSGTPDAGVDAATDWQGEFTWEVRVGAGDVIVRIDGVERDELMIVTSGEAAARELEIVV